MKDLVLTERDGGVAVVTLNRPQALNALNADMLDALLAVLEPLDADRAVGCVILTGSDKAFAAGADIAEMRDRDYPDTLLDDLLSGWEAIARLRTPKIAAVRGYALGGGCELAMMCDTIYCGRGARFGQPEIKLGVSPGLGGSQRLTRLVGKSVAMDMVLTGRTMDADEALRCGLVARVCDDDAVLDVAREAAATIAGFSRPAALLAREAVNRALETTLAEGLLFERRVFHALFGTDDQREGMTAFTEKREARFNRTES